ncbi:hypothetical protein B296_00049894 [Ensete ventricosum]|uniref:Uncharacterized protein n=1 Tax=Ensete ventricosum TaxID=4639 RepID=A0A426Y1D0_ENSVE|nr:hypothetical protein B296_00049894 [Ensete ventricosum]
MPLWFASYLGTVGDPFIICLSCAVSDCRKRFQGQKNNLIKRLVNMINLFTVNFQLEKLVSEDALHYDVISFHYYIQFHLHVQVRTDDLFC